MKKLFLFITCLIIILILYLFDFFDIKERFNYSLVKTFNATENSIIEELKKNLKELFIDTNVNFGGVLTKLNNRDFIKQIHLYPHNTESFTIDKKYVYICIKDPTTPGKYYNENLLMYVTLHEIAHTICDEIGHTSNFKEIFDNLLAYANSRGYYSYNIPIDQNYCKIE